jgi:hypothetical protein
MSIKSCCVFIDNLLNILFVNKNLFAIPTSVNTIYVVVVVVHLCKVNFPMFPIHLCFAHWLIMICPSPMVHGAPPMTFTKAKPQRSPLRSDVKLRKRGRSLGRAIGCHDHWIKGKSTGKPHFFLRKIDGFL